MIDVCKHVLQGSYTDKQGHLELTRIWMNFGASTHNVTTSLRELSPRHRLPLCRNNQNMDRSVSVGQGAGGDGSDFIPTLDSDKCLICLSPFGEQPVASLESCQHVFCLECILQWSQTANTCPVDRISFTFIHQRRRPAGDIQKKIEVRKQRKVVDEEEVRDLTFCQECGWSDRSRRLLVCIHCDSGYHMDCLTSSLNTTSEGDWICPECAVSPPGIEEEEVSDGELADLLADADDAASTTSRLRPSTINQPSSSTGTRHSQRIQDRAGRNPTPPSQPPWHVPKCLLRASSPADTADQLQS